MPGGEGQRFGESGHAASFKSDLVPVRTEHALWKV